MPSTEVNLKTGLKQRLRAAQAFTFLLIFTLLGSYDAKAQLRLLAEQFVTPLGGGQLEYAVEFRLENNTATPREFGTTRVGFALNSSLVLPSRILTPNEYNTQAFPSTNYIVDTLAVSPGSPRNSYTFTATQTGVNPSAKFEVGANSSIRLFTLTFRVGRCSNFTGTQTIFTNETSNLAYGTGDNVTRFTSFAATGTPPFSTPQVPVVTTFFPNTLLTTINKVLKPTLSQRITTTVVPASTSGLSYAYCEDQTIGIALNNLPPGLVQAGSNFYLCRRSGNSLNVFQAAPAAPSPLPNFNIPLTELTPGDGICILFRTADCWYTSDTIVIKIDKKDTLTPIVPVGHTNPNLGIYLCKQTLQQIPSPQYEYEITNFVYDYNQVSDSSRIRWRIDPPNAGVWVESSAPPINRISVLWDPNYTGEARIWAKLHNLCYGSRGDSVGLTVRISDGPPGVAPRPQLSGNRPFTDTICITDTAIAKVGFTAAFGDAYTYEWRTNPDTALRSRAVADVDDSTKVRFDWDRRFKGDAAYIVYRAVNGCGPGPWDSVQVLLRPLPPQQGRPYNIATPLFDTTCQTRRVDSTLFTFDLVRPELIGTGKKTFQWWVLPAPEKNGTTYQPVGNPAPTLMLQNTDSTRNNQLWVKWNPRFYGWVKIIVAARSKYCSFGNTYYDLPLKTRDSSSYGDTISKYFFVRPFPLRPSAPLGDRAIATPDDAGDTTTFYTLAGARFAKRYKWFISSTDSITDTLTARIGHFVNQPLDSIGTDSFDVKFVVASNPPPPKGNYNVFVVAFNECGLGDTSRLLRIKVSDAPLTTPIDTMGSFIVQGCNTPYYRRPSATDPLVRHSLCRNPANIVYKVSDTTAAYYKWELIPDTAGAIFAGPNPNNIPRGIRVAGPPCPGAPPVQTGLDSSAIIIDFNDNFVGTCTLRVTPINGFNDTLPLSASVGVSTERVIRIYDSPQVFAGIGGTVTGNTPYRLGGGDIIYPGLRPTATGGTKPYKSYNWTSNPATPVILPTNLAPLDSNPIIDVNTGGQFTVSLTVTDSNECTSTPSTAALEIRAAARFNVKLFLEGPYDTLTGNMFTHLYDDTYDTSRGGTDRNAPGIFDSLVKKTPEHIGPDFMHPGFRVPGDATVKPVDWLTFDVYDGEGESGLLQGTGKAWLMSDGTIRDFETGQFKMCRVQAAAPDALELSTQSIVVRHRNHLAIASKDVVQFTINTVPGDFVGSPSYVDLSDTTTVSVLGRNNRTLGYKLTKNFVGTTPRALIAAGDVSKSSPSFDLNYTNKSIDAADFYLIASQFIVNNLSVPTYVGYDYLDVNLDGRLTFDDFLIIDRNSKKLYYSIAP